MKTDYEIRDYALIGNCETAALVNTDGGVDWLCLPSFDSPFFFSALLDREKGGELFIRPSVPYETERSYLGDTAILRTRFRTGSGTVELTDFFVVARRGDARFYDFTSLEPVRKLVRLVRTEGGPVPMECVLKGRPNDARGRAAWERTEGGFSCALPRLSVFSDFGLDLKDGDLSARWTARTGRDHFLTLDFSERPAPPGPGRLEAWRSVTEAFWREWNFFNPYDGKFEDAVRRSAVTLKLLTHAPTGAFIAAPTTSLPERIGGDLNWDYRYAWVRDSSLVINALLRLGYAGEARAFFHFLLSRYAETGKLKVLYSIGRKPTEEKFLEHLSGYRGSRPVRVGNRAERQIQLDIYEELLESLLYYRQAGGRIDERMKDMVRGMVGDVTERWRQPDNGIWELQGQREHTYGKLMAWQALGHADALGFGDETLRKTREEIRRDILDHAVRKGDGHEYLAESYDSDQVGATGLFAFTTGFISESMGRSTRELVEKRLGRGPYLYRNEALRETGEGAFLLCSFWRINHLIQEGRLDEAESSLSEILKNGGPLLLFSEEIDPGSGRFLGNFPQAFTHLGIIDTVLNLEQSRRDPSYQALPDEQKFIKTIGRSLGLSGLLAGFARAPRTLGLLFSGRSKAPPAP